MNLFVAPLEPSELASSGPEQKKNVDQPLLLSVVVPTFNERANVRRLINRLDVALVGVAWEVVFVDDDSPDETYALVKSLARKDPRVRCLRRIGRRGLSGACIEGILSSSAPYVAVIDGDLQHDEAILPTMLDKLRANESDLAVGSRMVEGGAAQAGFNAFRATISRFANALARAVLRTEVRDVMSGMFMMRRDIFEKTAPNLSSEGFKILADILASTRSSGIALRSCEVAYAFRPREAGTSKLDTKVAMDFIGLLLTKATLGLLPVKFISFALVGCLGVGAHMLVQSWLMAEKIGFTKAQITATLLTIALNFFLNNAMTYRDRAVKGWRLLGGLAIFYGVCSIGAFANIAMARMIYDHGLPWWIAALGGIVNGATWNYALSALFVWKK